MAKQMLVSPLPTLFVVIIGS